MSGHVHHHYFEGNLGRRVGEDGAVLTAVGCDRVCRGDEMVELVMMTRSRCRRSRFSCRSFYFGDVCAVALVVVTMRDVVGMLLLMGWLSWNLWL